MAGLDAIEDDLDYSGDACSSCRDRPGRADGLLGFDMLFRQLMRASRLVPLVGLLAACRPIDGPWSGHCDWVGPKGAERAADLSLDLREPDDDGIGKGSARVTEEGGRQSADVVYLAAGKEIAVDLYLEDGDELYLRGTVDRDVATGACGSPVVEQFSLDELVNCVTGFELTCDTSPEWSVKNGEPAPIDRRDLDGDFRLAHD